MINWLINEVERRKMRIERDKRSYIDKEKEKKEGIKRR